MTDFVTTAITCTIVNFAVNFVAGNSRLLSQQIANTSMADTAGMTVGSSDDSVRLGTVPGLATFPTVELIWKAEVSAAVVQPGLDG